MLFETGVMDLQKNIVSSQDQAEKILLYCEVAVGRSYVYDGNPNLRQIPEGYNSFYIPTKQLDRNNDGDFNLEEYHAAANFDGRDARQEP